MHSVEEFRLGIGGPLHRLERAAHVEGLRRLVPLFIAASWAPLMVLALAQWLAHREAEPLLRDLSVHARLLVALPLFLVAERTLDRVARTAVGRLFDEGYVPPASTARVRALLREVERWRDRALPESILLVGALLAGAAALIGWVPPAGPIHGGIVASRLGAVRIWYGLVSLPLFQFLLWRSLFRWALWVIVLVGLARVPLRLLPAHADRRAGISFLKLPTVFFCSVMMLAASAVLCAGWATRVATSGTPLEAFRPLFFAFVLIGMLIAFAPLLLFSPQLLRARIAGLREYGGLVSDYVQRFQERWIRREDRTDVLGTQDIQSLADLSQSYRDNVEGMGIFLFSRADWAMLLAASFLPAIPLLFMEGTAHDVIKRLLRILVGSMA